MNLQTQFADIFFLNVDILDEYYEDVSKEYPKINQQKIKHPIKDKESQFFPQNNNKY